MAVKQRAGLIVATRTSRRSRVRRQLLTGRDGIAPGGKRIGHQPRGKLGEAASPRTAPAPNGTPRLRHSRPERLLRSGTFVRRAKARLPSWPRADAYKVSRLSSTLPEDGSQAEGRFDRGDKDVKEKPCQAPVADRT